MWFGGNVSPLNVNFFLSQNKSDDYFKLVLTIFLLTNFLFQVSLFLDQMSGISHGYQVAMKGKI